jgi:AcrR family transcriptional regulator
MSPTRKAAGPRRASRRAPAPHERQRDPERTKAKIIEAAVEEFAAKGFAGARVSAIAARAGVNQQLIAYYFDSKEGLYREIGRRWREHESQAIPEDMDFAETIKHYVRLSADERLAGRLLAWEGLDDTGEDGPDAEERNARLRQEVEQVRKRQQAGELDPGLDPAALILIGMSAGNALAVYPHLARGLFGQDTAAEDLVEHYAEQLAMLFSKLSKDPATPA